MPSNEIYILLPTPTLHNEDFGEFLRKSVQYIMIPKEANFSELFSLQAKVI